MPHKDHIDCPICNNAAYFVFRKVNTDYSMCTNCKTVFSDVLDNDNLVGGVAEVERNTQQNHLRIARVDEMTLGMKKEDVFILDWGCGTGYLIEDLKKAGYINTFGYDAYNPPFQKLPEKDKFHIVISVECFEHFSAPYVEVDVIHRVLKDNGVCYIETGYLDATREDGIADVDNPYINPDAGHSTIYTHHGMDVLMALRNFRPIQKFNRHCHLYGKR